MSDGHMEVFDVIVLFCVATIIIISLFTIHARSEWRQVYERINEWEFDVKYTHWEFHKREPDKQIDVFIKCDTTYFERQQRLYGRYYRIIEYRWYTINEERDTVLIKQKIWREER